MKERTWILLVAARYFRSRRKERGNSATLLSTAGIAVGVMTLISVLSVMNGFQLSTIDAILELNSYHVRIDGAGTLPPASLESLRSAPGIRAAFPFAEVQTLIRGVFPDPQICVLRALPDDIAELDPDLAGRLTMVDGSFDLAAERSVVLGSEMARFLGVRAGGEVSLLNLAGADFADLRPENLTFRVAGIFRSGYYEYDLGWGFVSLENADRFLAGRSERSVGIKLRDRFADGPALRAAEKAAGGGAVVRSWREYNRAIFGALRVEKIMMMVLICLIFVVVAGNIHQSLRRSVLERTEEIGLLKALGADPGSIRLVFVLEGAFIGLAGAFFGGLLGFLAAGRVNEIFAIAEKLLNVAIYFANALLRPYFPAGVGRQVSLFSPAYFYLSEVPSRIFLSEALFIHCFALFSSILAAYFASARVSAIKPAEVLRYE